MTSDDRARAATSVSAMSTDPLDYDGSVTKVAGAMSIIANPLHEVDHLTCIEALNALNFSNLINLIDVFLPPVVLNDQ